MIRPKGMPGMYDLKKIWNPSWFQGNRARKDYFEGWYFKQVSPDGAHSMAFIPGISLAAGDAHAFVQAIDGKTGQTWYFRYQPEEFAWSRHGFSVRVGESTFSRSHIELDLAGRNSRIRGRIGFSGQQTYRTSLVRPGIMGWYRYMPFMECYHGVVSMDHELDGKLSFDGREVDFSRGRGYIEKDWGSSMPKAWIWMQTNHFDQSGTSFMLSVADIPWIGRSFTGFLGYFLHDGRRHDFATWTGAGIHHIDNTREKTIVHIRGRGVSLQVTGRKNLSGTLMAPQKGAMQRIIHESVDAEIHIRLIDLNGHTLFDGWGRNAGFELVGDMDILKSRF